LGVHTLDGVISGPASGDRRRRDPLGFAGLQVALAAGAPLGEHVWGGTQERVLPAGT